jgi:rod shape-determining protein MreD
MRNWFHVVLLLLAAFVAVFLSATFNGMRLLVGAQFDLLPGLMVYTAMSYGLFSVTLMAVGGGVLFDALSANPLGASVLPLFLVGFIIQRYRKLILRTEFVAQLALGLGASAAVPVMTLVILLNTDKQPLLGWFSLWQWLAIAVISGTVTPFWFWLFEHLSRALNYRPWGEATFRQDREIKRGRK